MQQAAMKRDVEAVDPTALVDLGRYPILDIGTEAGRDLVARCRAALKADGMCKLEGFLTELGVEFLAGEANSLAHLSNATMKHCNPYFTKKDANWPDDHARNIFTPRGMGMVAGDLIPRDGGLQTLYHWDALKTFLAAVLGHERVYTLADKYQGLNISVMPAGPGHNWHFDDPQYAVTLMLQKPERGGDFETVSNIRTDDDENYDEVRAVLLGKRDNVKAIPFSPGTLMIFSGHYSLHHVSPVEGDRLRLISVLSYSTVDGFHGSPIANKLVYGERAV